jgi:hypothetical protein
MTITTTITSTEFRSIRRQAVREQEAEKAGFACCADMVAAHRAERRAQMQRLRETRARCA